MANSFSDGFTARMLVKMSEYEQKIFDIEDEIESRSGNEADIIAYLNDIRCSLPLGLALRRYICTKFKSGSDEENHTTSFTLANGRTVTVSDYNSEDYDICEDDVKEYTDVFMDINARYNTDADGNLVSDINRAEARRLIKVTTECLRSKMFLIGFALHMDSGEMHKFLTDVLGEQTYNYRNPEEVIAYYCHTHEECNSYPEYLRIKEAYKKQTEVTPAKDIPKANYTEFARLAINFTVNSEEDLIKFLLDNRANFSGYSETAYNEFMSLYNKVLEKVTYQTLSNDSYLRDSAGNTAEQIHKYAEEYNKAIPLQQVKNTEQLAKRMLQCIPRATVETVGKDGKKVVTNDFIPIYNGENGQKSNKVQTTTLPKSITKNLLIKDRLDDLINRVKPVERKDLVFLKFFLLSLKFEDSEKEYSYHDYKVFIEECNNMLLSCGMSRLYPANRFENLILLSLISSNPFEMFENIIDASFINEPHYTESDE